MTTDGGSTSPVWRRPAGAGGEDYRGWAGEWLSGAQMLPVTHAAPGDHLRAAVAQFAEATAGLASVDLGEWQGAAARSARGRVAGVLLLAGDLESRLLEAQTALDLQERAVRQALLGAAGAS